MLDYRPHMMPKVRSQAIMAAAHGSPCTLRICSFIPGHSCAPSSTVVGCHLAGPGKGVSTKVTDLGVAFGCANCHDLIDGRDARLQFLLEKYPAAFHERLRNGLIETLTILVDRGVLIVPDAEVI